MNFIKNPTFGFNSWYYKMWKTNITQEIDSLAKFSDRNFIWMEFQLESFFKEGIYWLYDI